MDPLDKASKSMEILRLRLSENLERLRADGRLAAPQAPAGSARPEPARQKARLAVQKRLDTLDPNDPAFAERAADAFVESVLLAEFGDEFSNDANFRQLILDVSREMRLDPAMSERLARLFAELRAG